jgi:hypothetical protein
MTPAVRPDVYAAELQRERPRQTPEAQFCGHVSRSYFFRRLYGDWFGGFNEIPFSAALLRTPPSGRPSFTPMTRVGVFPCASSRSCFTSWGFQGFPAFRVDLGIAYSLTMTSARADPTDRVDETGSPNICRTSAAGKLDAWSNSGPRACRLAIGGS